MRLSPRRLAMVGLTLHALTPSAARADESAAQRHTCEDSYVAAQSLRREGRLLAARDALLVCSHDPCPQDLRVDCEKWATDNDKSIPSIVVTVRDHDGQYVTEGHVVVDGRAAGGLTGRAIDLDPGLHEIRIDGIPWGVQPQRIVVPEGDHLHAIAFTEPPPPPARPRWPMYLTAGVAAAGVASVLGLGLEGLHARSDSCPGGSCPTHAAYSSVNSWYVGADISLAVTVVAAGAFTVLLATGGASNTRKAAMRGLAEGWQF